MKSIRLLLGVMICMCFVAIQAQASTQDVTLNFESLTGNDQIASYGNEYGLTFSGSWALGFEDETNTIYKRLTTNISSNVGIILSEDSIYKIDEFSYLAYEDVSFKALYWDTSYEYVSSLDGLGEDAVELVSFSVLDLYAYGLLKSITFSRDTASTSLFLDNVKLTAVPVPAAALLLGAGLLGIVGVRRRQLS